MRYTGFFPSSDFPLLSYLLPAPCSLKPKNLYLTQLQTAIKTHVRPTPYPSGTLRSHPPNR
ncbi:MAG: hypothetical protein F6K50_16135 [Moorea sp. SIO3I7]|nr:hypothetical protein [Moorena sp. SIO3I7]